MVFVIIWRNVPLYLQKTTLNFKKCKSHSSFLFLIIFTAIKFWRKLCSFSIFQRCKISVYLNTVLLLTFNIAHHCNIKYECVIYNKYMYKHLLQKTSLLLIKKLPVSERDAFFRFAFYGYANNDVLFFSVYTFFFISFVQET